MDSICRDEFDQEGQKNRILMAVVAQGRSQRIDDQYCEILRSMTQIRS
jgi:hypothetical protein